MSDNKLSHLSVLDGFISACVFDAQTGDAMVAEGESLVSFDEMGPLICEVMQAHEQVPDYYGADPSRKAEEIFFTLGEQVHMLRPLEGDTAFLAHLVLERVASNVGHARMQLSRVSM